MARHEEVRSFTGLRGVAAVYVVLFHFFPVLHTVNPLTRIFTHGYIVVDLFFVLSGFVMAMTYGHMFLARWNTATYLKFLGRRIARVYPLYLLVCIISFLLILAGVRHLPIRNLPVTVIANFLMVQVLGIGESIDLPAWSISAEFIAYLLFPLLLVPALSRKRLWAWLSAAISVAVVSALAYLPMAFTHRQHVQSLLDLSDYHYAVPAIRCLAEFSLGLLSYRVYVTSSAATLVRFNRMAALLCLLIIVLLIKAGSDVAVVLLFPPLLIALVTPQTLPARFLGSAVPMFLGNISYSIYLVHGLIFELLDSLNHRANAHGVYHVARYINSAGMLLILLIAWIVHRTLEVPARKWLRHVFERGREPAIVAGL